MAGLSSSISSVKHQSVIEEAPRREGRNTCYIKYPPVEADLVKNHTIRSAFGHKPADLPVVPGLQGLGLATCRLT